MIRQSSLKSKGRGKQEEGGKLSAEVKSEQIGRLSLISENAGPQPTVKEAILRPVIPIEEEKVEDTRPDRVSESWNLSEISDDLRDKTVQVQIGKIGVTSSSKNLFKSVQRIPYPLMRNTELLLTEDKYQFGPTLAKTQTFGMDNEDFSISLDLGEKTEI